MILCGAVVGGLAIVGAVSLTVSASVAGVAAWLWWTERGAYVDGWALLRGVVQRIRWWPWEAIGFWTVAVLLVVGFLWSVAVLVSAVASP